MTRFEQRKQDYYKAYERLNEATKEPVSDIVTNGNLCEFFMNNNIYLLTIQKMFNKLTNAII
ncbi:MAG: hypothetical protein J6A89_08270 [Clostridia bacterium]|nr:hypothetical protein [Clostridia bacterium]